jgi:hypothetical protein
MRAGRGRNEQSFYGYKNHIRYPETDTSVHDSQKLDEVLDGSNSSTEAWADSAYRAVESEARLGGRHWQRAAAVHRKALSEKKMIITVSGLPWQADHQQGLVGRGRLVLLHL